MPDFHPVQILKPIEFRFPVPGDDELWAVVRRVNLFREGEPISCWRAFTFAEPRKLFGYSDDLEALAMQCHRHAMVRGGDPALNPTPRFDQAEYVSQARPATSRMRASRGRRGA